MLLFIDANFWVCSVDLKTQIDQNASKPTALDQGGGISVSRQAKPLTPARRHFFALSEWRNAEQKLGCAIVPAVGTADGGILSLPRRGQVNFAFVLGDHVIVVEGGMGFSEPIALNTSDGTHPEELEIQNYVISQPLQDSATRVATIADSRHIKTT